MSTYTVARDMLRGRASKKIGNNTWARLGNAGAVSIVLHDTAVVSVLEDGAVVLDSGGWSTYTTKDRINDALGDLFRGCDFHWSVYQAAGVWYLVRQENGAGWHDGARYTFADGMTILPDGVTVSGAGAIGAEAEQKKLRRDIKKYAAAFVNALFAGEIPAPGAGDCFYCAMRVDGSDLTLGELVDDSDHLTMHMAEGYFVPSLLARATEMYPVAPVAMWVISDKWAATNNNAASIPGVANVARRQLVSSLERFIRHCFGLA